MRQGGIINAINVPLGMMKKGELKEEAPIIGVPGMIVRKTFIIIEPLGRRSGGTRLHEFLEGHAHGQDRFSTGAPSKDGAFIVSL